jgi:hypothetical protein
MKWNQKLPTWINVSAIILLAVIVMLLIVIIYRL